MAQKAQNGHFFVKIFDLQKSQIQPKIFRPQDPKVRLFITRQTSAELHDQRLEKRTQISKMTIFGFYAFLRFF